MFNPMILLGILMACGAGIGAGLLLVAQFLSKMAWPMDVIIYEKRGNGFNVIVDRAKKFRGKDAQTYFRLKKVARQIKPVAFENILISGKRPLVELYSPNRDEYFGMKFSMDKGDLQVIDDDMKFHFIQAQRATLNRWKEPDTMLQTLMPFMLVLVPGVLIVVMLVITFDKMAAITTGLNGVTAGLKDVITTLTTQGIPVTATPTPILPPPP